MKTDFDLNIPIPVQDTDADKTIVAEEANKTQALQPVHCPVCGTDNLPGEEFCSDCGFLLSSEPGEAPAEETEAPKLVNESTGQDFWLAMGENKIGREGPDIVINDSTVSRRHARIIQDENGLTLEDLGSTNGTKVDGDRLSPGETRRLSSGQILKFGNVSLRLVIPGEPEVSVEESEAEETPQPELAALTTEAGLVFTLTAKDVTTLGRRSSNDIQLEGDPYVSGKHGQILYQDGKFLFDDVGSTNGSQVNDQKITPGQPVELTDGDTLTLGRTALTFALKSEPVESENESEMIEEESSDFADAEKL